MAAARAITMRDTRKSRNVSAACGLSAYSDQIFFPIDMNLLTVS